MTRDHPPFSPYRHVHLIPPHPFCVKSFCRWTLPLLPSSPRARRPLPPPARTTPPSCCSWPPPPRSRKPPLGPLPPPRAPPSRLLISFGLCPHSPQTQPPPRLPLAVLLDIPSLHLNLHHPRGLLATLSPGWPPSPWSTPSPPSTSNQSPPIPSFG